jgi:hypothetical protein
MQRQVVRLTRQELYEKMWLRPAISLAAEFGISGRGLGKICRRFEIPVPPRGYWARLAAGKHVTRPPLPSASSDLPSEILIQPSPEAPAAALPEQVRAEVTAVLENRDQIRSISHPCSIHRARNLMLQAILRRKARWENVFEGAYPSH